ncbi:NmrA family NAD(P)-binding protein [Spiractinospora alimapuensis]|uniref:SDR family oxidoreductase n=1 Tax=Spiractinospora alimapuensis TaxID=2820884 RepID=UPI001F3BC84A|nr:NmrA family NAD(P)-binding protein [Spiractinospora alimapuensis]QVQ53679.1 NmrA family NAD(P)-binding protein [Spiractinospora alimapuensis]
MTSPVLVTGAAGKTGRAVIEALRARDLPTRALVRRPEQADAARAAGATEVRVGDMRDRDDVAEALRGTTGVYHIAPNMSGAEVAIGEALIGAAQATGVRRVVYHSVLRPQIRAMPHHWDKLLVEAALFETGMDVTVLQPGPYTQNLLEGLDRVREHGELRVPYRVDAPFGMVDLRDVAEVAARCLAEERYRGGTYELVGPEAVTAESVARDLGATLGRDVRAVRIDPADWAATARSRAVPEHVVTALAAMFSYYDAYGLPGNGRVLTALLGHAGTSVSDVFARELTKP